MYFKYTFYLIIIIVNFTKIIGMNITDVPTELQENLKKNKKKILVIMTHKNKKVDLESIGTFYNSIRVFFYLDDEKIRKSIPYYVIEKILDSDDEEFNIGGMYNGEIRVPNCPSEKDLLNPKKNNHNCCWIPCCYQ